MAHRSNGHVPDQSPLDISGVRTLQDLAGLLRTLRRRHARQRRDGELTYRELAARTGWSTAAIAEYLTGKTLPPTDRFDALIGLFGATPVEQGVLATARDRVAEHHRRTPNPTSHRPGRSARQVVPQQLPADVFAFTGRADQLACLDAMLTGPAGAVPTAVVISAVSGTAGVGKTALAVHWAHRVADRFPDGQLYVNLRGYDPEQPMGPGDALVRLLASLGVSGADIPLDVEDRAARYRTQLAGRRMLVVLDNAATVEQVRPLLPGTSSCAVVVTSRDSLAGLVARDGARRVDLDLLPLSDAVALLSHLLGPRAEAEPEAVTTLANLCARLPLALRVAAELAVSRPAISLADLTAELADRQKRLELMDAGGDPRAAVVAVFSWSVQHLPAAVARTFRLSGLHPGPDLDCYAVAALADTDPAFVRRDLDVLARAHLIQSTAPGRYGMHDLLRAYAAHLVSAHEADDDRRTAQRRLFDVYLATAAAATDLLHPGDTHEWPRTPAPATPATPTVELADAQTARTWLDTERPNLVAVAAYTATNGWPAHTIELSTILYRHFDGGRYTDALTIHTHAHHAAELTGDKSGQARALLDLGTTHLHISQYQRATEHLQEALTLFQQVGDHAGQGRALSSLGILERRRGRHEPAVAYFEQALSLARQAGDNAGQARVLINLGNVEALLRSRYDAAIDHFQQALALSRHAGNQLNEARALSNLGLVEHRLNRHGTATDHLQQALAGFRQLGNRQGEADVLDSLGSVHISLGQPQMAIEHFTQALSLFSEIGVRDGQAWALNGLGEAAQATGQPTDAVAHHTGALAVATDIGSRDQQARAHAGLGHAHRALSDLARARHHLQQALTDYTELRSLEADTIRTLLATLSPTTEESPEALAS